MNQTNGRSPRTLLREIARLALQARGFEPDFPPAMAAELAGIRGPATGDARTRDLRALLWCSIDNDDSRDLDQLSVGEARPDGGTKLFVAVADVAAVVRAAGPIDRHARQNTTSIYTVAEIFPMLPERLSTDLTSLNFNEDRLAIVVEMALARSGDLERSEVFPALVRNRAKLAYNRVAAWLEAGGERPAAVGAVPGLEENLRLQVAAAQLLKARRHEHGALTFEKAEARPIFSDGRLEDLRAEARNVAKDLIEDLMIAANGVVARFLAAKKFPSIRRVVRTPKHWDRIVELAAERGAVLPAVADARALSEFLLAAKAADPLRFPDLSLSVIKLLGAGEYVVELPGGSAPGHFGLAVKDYAHSTAPNRRYPDLIAQRLVKAALAGGRPPYDNDELAELARHCTEQEDGAKKIERQVVKSAAAMLLEHRIGEWFDALVTGAADKGTWVRIARPLVEGKLVEGFVGRKVGQQLRVRLVRTDVPRGQIDFAAAG